VQLHCWQMSSSNHIVVGGGLGGLLTCHLLKQKGLPAIGFESTARLGGLLEVGHHRLYEESSVELLKDLCPDLQWECIDEEPKERRKGEWHNLQGNYSPEEHYYLGKKFFRPTTDFVTFLHSLIETVKENFHTNKVATEIHPDKKIILCQDGSEWEYEKIYWCADIRGLLRVWKGDKSALLKSLKKLKPYPAGLNIDFELSEGLLPVKNSAVFPLRYKDKKLNAIGIEEGSSNKTLHWTLFIDREAAEDREEVAKYVRAIKREIQKEFPELKDRIRKEKIVFSPEVPGESAVTVESLAVLENILYVGPDVCLSESEVHLTHLDRTVSNFRNLQSTI
jgi:hypothetical protein